MTNAVTFQAWTRDRLREKGKVFVSYQQHNNYFLLKSHLFLVKGRLNQHKFHTQLFYLFP